MKKELSEQIWSVEGYTNKIHVGVRQSMLSNSHLSFTVVQLFPFLQRGYPWLKILNERQEILLKQIIKTALTKLVQKGEVKKVFSSVQVDPQWQWASKVEDSGYVDVTSQDDVAQTDEAKKAIKHRSIGGQTLWRLNQKAKLGVLHN
jgi:hypothetical protein